MRGKNGGIFRIVFFLTLFVLLLQNVNAAYGTGGTIDVNLLEIFDAADSNTLGGTINIDFVLGEDPSDVMTSSSTLAGQLGVYFDRSRPSVSITSPTNGSSTTSTSVTLSYTVTPGGNPISTHWVKIDSNPWIDNNLNTSYIFSGLSAGSHTFYVIATDSSDNNSTTASVTITITEEDDGGDDDGGGGSGGGGGAGGGGGGGSSGQINEEALDNPLNLISKTYYFDDPVIYDCNLQVQRIAVKRIVRAGGGAIATYYTFRLNVKNLSEQRYTDIEIIENIDADISTRSRRISYSPRYDELLNTPPPSVKWVIDSLKGGEDLNLSYTVNGLENSDAELEFEKFFKNLADAQVEIKGDSCKTDFLCKDVDCDDKNECTIDSCSEGECVFVPDVGAECGDDGVCNKKGVCEEKTPSGNIILPEIKIEVPKFKDLIKAGIVVVILAAWVMVSLFFVLYKRRRRIRGLADL